MTFPPSTNDVDALLGALFDPSATGPEAPETADRAILGGLRADGVGGAFRAGYLAAMTRLSGSARPSCLAASEEGGAHPRNVRTRLVEADGGYLLDGKKSWVTLATEVEELFVVATTGEHEGRNRLRLVRVPVGAAGLTVTARPPTTFAPEIPHATATFAAVRVPASDVLPGDGYSEYLKPFRTIEDAHVTCAVLAYLVGLARRHTFPTAVVLEVLPLLLSARAVAAASPTAPETHLALAGTFAGLARLLGADATNAAFDTMPEDERVRLRRDLPLLLVAEKARAARLEAAIAAIARAAT